MAAAAATTEQANAGNYKYGIVSTILDADAQTKSEKVIVTENMTGNGEYYTVSG